MTGKVKGFGERGWGLFGEHLRLFGGGAARNSFGCRRLGLGDEGDEEFYFVRA